MASKYDWDFIRPLDQTANIAAMAQGNQQVNAGLQGIAGAVTGYADSMKQRNTDEIMNALYAAQTSSDLPQAMQAVQALQQQYGRGYDQNAVRSAIDTRGSTLGQRDLQAINLQQAQAAQAAIPILNQASAAEAIRMGANPEQMNALAALGINASTDINRFGSNAQGDSRYEAGLALAAKNRAEDQAYRAGRDAVSDAQWAEGNARSNLQAAYSMSDGLTPQAQSGYAVDANGNLVTIGQAGGSRIDTMSALMGSLFNTESGGVHRQSNGQLTTSPKGALGVAQIMPTTAAKPGYGMKPINLQNTSAEEQKAWATEYIGRIGKAHNFTTEQAVAAYNAGPGAVKTAIQKGGNNWLAQLPKETQNYVPKVMGGSGATKAIGNAVSQANMSKVTSQYQNAMAKLEGDYSTQSAKDQVKGSLATTGKNVDTWAAGKKDSGLLFSSNNSYFTKAGDIAKMAKADPSFNKLPEAAQINVLEGAYAKMNDVNAFQYVPDGDLKKFISNESRNYQKDRISQHSQAKKAIQEQAYQNVVQQFQAVGSKPPSRESVMQMLDPQYKAPAPKAQPKTSTPAPAKPVAKAAPKVQSVNKMDQHLAEREKRKQAEWDKVLSKRPVKKEAVKPTSNFKPQAFKVPAGSTNLSQADLDKWLKNTKAR